MQPGQRIGPYEVVRELGRGAMGVVFEVRAAEPHAAANGRLALKLLLDPEPTFAARFAREVRVQQFLGRHRHVLPCLDAGQHGPNPYLVMPLAQGGTLEERVRAGAPLAATAPLLIQAARAAHFAHEADIVHRDIKPANVLIGPDGGALLADFGVARSLTGERLTQTGGVVGSPATMAPEQAGGEAIDRRTDVYALGATLYQALTGRLPFDASTTVAWIRKILDEEPIPPRSVRPDLPPALEAVCLKAMAKRPVDRYPTAEAFAAALEDALRGAPRGPAEGRRRGVALALAAAALGLLAGAGLGFVVRGPSDEPAARVAPPPAPRPAEPTLTTPAPSPPPLERAASALADGEDEAALQVLLDALAAADPATPAGERLSWVLLAHALDERALLERGGDAAAAALEEAALAALRATALEDGSRAPTVARARGWLDLARLCAPKRPLRTAAEELRRLGEAPSRELREAARPWLRAFAADEVDPLLTEPPYPPEVCARAVCNLDHELRQRMNAPSWPTGWRGLLALASNASVLPALVQEALLWHPELSFLWAELGIRGARLPDARVARWLDVAAERERSLELAFMQTQVLHVLGRREPAGEAALRLRAARTDRRPSHRSYDWHLIVDTLTDSPVSAHVREGLALILDDKYDPAFAGDLARSLELESWRRGLVMLERVEQESARAGAALRAADPDMLAREARALRDRVRRQLR